MEPTSRPHVSPNIREANMMNRSVALRAFAVFTTITVLATMAGISSQAAIAEAIFFIGILLAAIMLGAALLAPSAQPIPVRVRTRR